MLFWATGGLLMLSVVPPFWEKNPFLARPRRALVQGISPIESS
jgi:hypothetical protein